MEHEFDQIAADPVETPVVEETTETVAAVEETPLPEPAPFELELAPGNLVVQLTLMGSEAYLFGPVPASGSAAKRLRARSFRVAALKETMAKHISDRLGVIPLFGWNDRCLLAGPAMSDWEEVLRSLQRDFDTWLFQHLHPAGVLQSFVVGAVSEGGRVPVTALEGQLQQRMRQPMDGALRIGPRWNGKAFVLPAGPTQARCSGCGAVAPARLFGDETLCDPCARDTEAGERLPNIHRAWFCPDSEADLAGPGVGLVFVEPADATRAPLALDAAYWPLLRRVPTEEGRALSFDDLANKSAGARKYLGYLLIEVDGLDKIAAGLEGDPGKFLAVSRALDQFSGEQLQNLLEGFPALFAVPSSGGALLIGPWQDVFNAAAKLKHIAGELSLSAGIALAPVSIPLQGAVADARRELHAAQRAGGVRLSVFGTVNEWRNVPALLDQAKKLASWLKQRAITAGWLESLVRLHAASKTDSAAWRPMLASTVRSGLKHGPARQWAARLLHDGGSADWEAIEFLARYASLAGSAPKAQEPAAEAEAEPEAEAPAGETPALPSDTVVGEESEM